MEDLFKNAKFGDKFKTRDGRKAIYNGRSIDRYWLIVEQHPWNLIGFDSCGRHSGLEEDIDIISEWQEPIDEEELDKMATKYSDDELKEFENDYYWSTCADELVCSAREEGTYKAFIAGYRKAKGE